MTIAHIENGDSGASARAKLNLAIDEANKVPFKADMLVYASERPGDAANFFTASLSSSTTVVAGEASGESVLAGGSVVTAAEGKVYRITGSAIVAPRADIHLTPGTVSVARWGASRAALPADPVGDTVRYAIGWLAADKSLISSTIVDEYNILPATGVRAISATVSRDMDADYTAPDTARYWRPYIQIFGGSGTTTDVEFIYAYESNGLPGPQGNEGDITPELEAARDAALAAQTASETARDAAEGFKDDAEAAAADAASQVVNRLLKVASRTALKALDTGTHTQVYLYEAGREGIFAWKTGNYSALITVDTAEGVYIKADAVASSSGAWVRTDVEAYRPRWFGAAGDATTDDGAALNAMFALVRYFANSLGTSNLLPVNVNLGGGTYRTTISINATNIVAWNLLIVGGRINGECTGKGVLDLSGSRGYSLIGTGVYGDKTNRPAAGIQLSRTATTAFCDNCSFYEVSTTGWFSRAALHVYGHETALHSHCTYFNYDHTGRVAIFEGYSNTSFTSDYDTLISGGTSFINNKVVSCDFRYLPSAENIATVTGITNASSGVVTCPGHSFAVNDEVVFANVGGMPNLFRYIGTVTATTTNTITVNINTTSLGTYTSGGQVIRRQTKCSVYLSRAEQFNFDCSYIVGYGQPQLELDFPESGYRLMKQLDLDLLFEGSGNNSNVLFNLRSAGCVVQGFRFKNYNGNGANATWGLQSGGSISLFDVYLSLANPMTAVPLVGSGTEAQMAMYGANVLVSGISNFPYGSFAAFKGFITDTSTGNFYSRGITAL